MSDEKLLPCPFCGGEGLVSKMLLTTALWKASCKNCDANRHGSFSKAGAIAAWNQRTPATGSADAEALRERALRHIAGADPGSQSDQSLAHDMAAVAKQAIAAITGAKS